MNEQLLHYLFRPFFSKIMLFWPERSVVLPVLFSILNTMENNSIFTCLSFFSYSVCFPHDWDKDLNLKWQMNPRKLWYTITRENVPLTGEVHCILSLWPNHGHIFLYRMIKIKKLTFQTCFVSVILVFQIVTTLQTKKLS